MAKSVGYKKPPANTRWQKGQSGNPSGRKKGQRNLKTDLAAELSEMVQITESGVPRRMTKQRALLKAVLARAIGGDGRAVGQIISLVESLLDADAPQAPTQADISAEDEALLEAFLARRQPPEEAQDD